MWRRVFVLFMSFFKHRQPQNLSTTHLVSIKMSDRSDSFFLFFYNVTAVLCLTCRNQTFKVSRYYGVLNLTLLPFTIISFQVFIFSPYYNELILVDAAVDFSSYSIFSKILMVVWFQFASVTAIYICISNWRNRKKLEVLVNRLFHVYENLDLSLKKSFRQKLRRSFAITLTLLVYDILFQFSTLNFTVGTVAISFLTVYPNLVVLSFLSFVKHFQLLLAMSLKNLEKRLNCCCDKSLKRNEFQRIFIDYQSVYEVCQQFKEIFEPPLSLSVCCMGVMITLDVSFILT